MIPQQDELDIAFVNNGIEVVTMPSLTYKMVVEDEKVVGTVDDIEALKQAIYKEINTEPDFIIYENYGVKKTDLFGKPKEFAFVKLCKRIEDALTNDDRILKVYDFFYHKELSKNSDLCMSFTVDTIFGEIRFKGVLEVGI